MKTIKQLSPDEILEHRGDLTIEGNVGKNAQINIKEGSLLINGHVEDGVHIIVEVSEKLRNTIKTSGITELYADTSNINLVAAPNSTVIVRSYGISSRMKTGNKYMGDVKIGDRIFTDYQVIEQGNGVYIISAIDDDWACLFEKNENPEYISATIDGTEYKGRKIVVHGKIVIVDDKIASTSQSAESSTNNHTNASDYQPKVRINGDLGDKVHLTTDVELTAKAIGKNCVIKSVYGGITATSIGDQTRVTALGAIKVETVGDKCVIKSVQNGVQAKIIGETSTVEASEAIIIESDVSGYSSLSSKQSTIRAENIGEHVSIFASNAIQVKNVGHHSEIKSDKNSIRAEAVNDSVRIEAYKEICLTSIGKSSSIISLQKDIIIYDNVGQESTLLAEENIAVGIVGDEVSLTSNQGEITNPRGAGHSIVMKAKGSISLKTVGNNAVIESLQEDVSLKNIGINGRITALKEISCRGTCPDPDSLTLTCPGEITKPKKWVETKNPQSQVPTYFSQQSDSSSPDFFSSTKVERVPIKAKSADEASATLGLMLENLSLGNPQSKPK